MDEPQTWRELLGRVINDPLERQRLATALNVNAITLSRWASGSSTPRPDNVRNLIDALPQHHQQLITLIAQDFPEFSPNATATDELPLEIPSAFYAQILSAHADIPDSLYFWSVCKLTLKQMLEQLDPRRLGMVIMVAQCTPPSGQNKVRSLRGNARQGTIPLSDTLEQEPVLLGAESLSGRVVATCRPATVQNTDEESTLKGHLIPVLRSGTAYPILRRSRIAGCIAIVSTQVDYFTPARLNLIHQYANLIALAFQPDEFYDPRRIELGVMPPTEIQKPYFSTFRQRVADEMKAAASSGRPISSLDAEQLIWQQLEEELLQLPIYSLSE